MSAPNYDSPRRFSRPASARTFPETYYDERHASFDYSRADPYAYPMGGPVHGLRNRAHAERDEFQPEQGGSRRRIAVACARCRKRKIRCSGDKGDGQGCQNCKAAGVEASQCQFHRVGSDHVQKVMDNFSMVQSLANMASAHNIMPVYPIGEKGSYHRSVQGQLYSQPHARFGYSQLDTSSAYAQDWTAPYGDETSTIDNYSFDQASTYLPSPATPSKPNMYGDSYRWTSNTARLDQPTTSYYSDYGHSYSTNGLPYLQTDLRHAVPPESVSPLNMSSLRLSLPDGPRQHQCQPTEVPITPTQRRLPRPQPNSGQVQHHALDQQQGQRLRSSQTISTPSYSDLTPSYASASFTKPLLPWATANENLMNAVNETAAAAMPPPASHVAPIKATETSPNSYPANKSLEDVSTATHAAPPADIDFGTLPFLDPSTISAPTPPAYSNFRDSRDIPSSLTELPRNESSSNLYTCDVTSRRPSNLGGNSSGVLVSGHQYTPLARPKDMTNMKNLTREPFESPNVPAHRTSTSNLNSGF